MKHTGMCQGKYRCLNIPLRKGVTDTLFVRLFSLVCAKVFARFRPSVIVMQCGADALSNDPVQAFNLTTRGMGQCLSFVLSVKLPVLVLGGGGYDVPSVARCWTHLLGICVNCALSEEIPDHKHYLMYGPTFALHTAPVHTRRNRNTKAYVMRLMKHVNDVLKAEHFERVLRTHKHEHKHKHKPNTHTHTTNTHTHTTNIHTHKPNTHTHTTNTQQNKTNTHTHKPSTHTHTTKAEVSGGKKRKAVCVVHGHTSPLKRQKTQLNDNTNGVSIS